MPDRSDHHRSPSSPDGGRRYRGHRSHHDDERSRRNGKYGLDRDPGRGDYDHSSRHRSARDEERDEEDRSSRKRSRRDGDAGEHEQHRGRHHTSPHHRSSHRRRETSAERYERKRAEKRAARKAEKRAKLAEEEEAEERRKHAEVLMYAGDENPITDPSLAAQQFRWVKKEEQERRQGLTPEEARRRDEIRRRDAEEEIARLTAKRIQREREALARQEEEERVSRLQQDQGAIEWVEKEDEFYLEQSRKRAAIRIRENRARPIDLMAMNLRWAEPGAGKRRSARSIEQALAARRGQVMGAPDDPDLAIVDDDEEDEAGLEVDLQEPHTIFQMLTLPEVEELEQDIRMYLDLEKDERHIDFWKSLLLICDDKLASLRAEQSQFTPSLDPAVQQKMSDMLASKSEEQLLQLQSSVEDKLASGEPVDVEYWELLLRKIVAALARERLRAVHKVVLANRIEYLRRKQREVAAAHQHALEADMQTGSHGTLRPGSTGHLDTPLTPNVDEPAKFTSDMEPPTITEAEYALLPFDEQVAIVSQEEDRSVLLRARQEVLSVAFVPMPRAALPAASSKMADAGGVALEELREGESDEEGRDRELALYQAEASRAMELDQEAFNEPASFGRPASYGWENKYRPRKPRFFNRVATGYEWNKYNQTHYDHDNPPPKVVQGYKFNIFYPDLIDPTRAPTYEIRKIPGDDETVLLVFRAGPPYEDIAFRIINKPWEMGRRKGFRNSFDRGVLQLYFNFTRLRYRK